jgi:D-serine deaminase-like pyridoxal phosphate-dependent protein
MATSESLYPSLDTPCVLLDLDKLEANIKEMSTLAAEAGVLLRPHIKVHQSVLITKMQVEAGACGIEVGTIDQAEVFAAEGFDDIMVAHPFFGQLKMDKLKGLLGQPNLPSRSGRRAKGAGSAQNRDRRRPVRRSTGQASPATGKNSVIASGDRISRYLHP